VARLEKVLHGRIHQAIGQLWVREFDPDRHRPFARRHPQLVPQEVGEVDDLFLLRRRREQLAPDEVLEPEHRRAVDRPVLEQLGLLDHGDEVVVALNRLRCLARRRVGLDRNGAGGVAQRRHDRVALRLQGGLDPVRLRQREHQAEREGDDAEPDEQEEQLVPADGVEDEPRVGSDHRPVEELGRLAPALAGDLLLEEPGPWRRKRLLGP